MQTQAKEVNSFERVKSALLESNQFKKTVKINNEFSDKKLSLEESATSYANTFVKDVMPYLEGLPIYGQVLSVSYSGMSRTASFYYIRDNQIVNLNWWMKLILDQGTGKDKYTLKLNGCGMDMLFDAVYRFSHAVKDDGYYYKKVNL